MLLQFDLLLKINTFIHIFNILFSMKKFLMISMVLTILAASIVLLQMSSCTKAVAQTRTDTIYKCQGNITGLWSGTLSDSNNVSQPYNLSIKADGTVTFEGIVTGNQEHFGLGTWTLTDSLLTCYVTTVYGYSYNVGTKQKLTAIYNKANGTLLNGAWTNISQSVNSGTFSVAKIN